ncbi:MAG: hypothetical protein K1X88_08495, partial [Nannocystaceae bacterium]|nr:hypothetical protein [Nannocystaceae bacterium]
SAAVVAAPLHRPSPLVGPAGAALREQLATLELVVDLAWVSSWGARVRLWGWRREPARRAVAARLGTVLSLGLHAPQQWVCESPTPMLVTLATLTRS